MLPSPSPFWFVSVHAVPCARCGGGGVGWQADARTAAACSACLGTGQRPRVSVAHPARAAAWLGGALLALVALLTVL